MQVVVLPLRNVPYCLDWSDAKQRPLVLNRDFAKLTHVSAQHE